MNITEKDLPKVPDSDPVWDVIADYLSQICMNIVLLTSAEVIVIGGGVMKRDILYPKIREKFKSNLNGYVQHERLNSKFKICLKIKYFYY